MTNDLGIWSGITLAVIADTHINSTTGLCPPSFRLDDGGTYQASRFQAQLWRCFLDYCDKARDMSRGGELWTVIAGDLVDGDHHNTPQIITRNLTDQHRMAIAGLSPLLEISDKVWVLRGTSAHARSAGQSEELIAREIGAQPTPNGNFSFYRLALEPDGVRFDLAHHGSMGRLPWTKGNPVRRLAIEIELEYYRMGQRPPDYVLRAHRHQFADSGLDNPVRVFFLPAWQGPTDYVHAIAPGAQPSIGGMLFRMTNGQAAVKPVVYTATGGSGEDVEWTN